ncbi:YfcC family protein [Aquihabitans sp. McL0605]|uniref:YfcC family protein n=1 Tax=Aquihabitans sp. McL0605 TaxID=3415671 RepID=UPI003CF7F28F
MPDDQVLSTEAADVEPDDLVSDGGAGDGGAPPADADDGGPKQVRFPTALTVLAIVLGVVWIASFFIPSGTYKVDPETGGPVPGSYHELPACKNVEEGTICVDKSVGAQFKLLWRAPPNGLYGIQSATTQYVSPDEEGFLYGSAQIFFFVLAVGAFITVTMKTGAIETGIGRLAKRFSKTPIVLIVVLMAIFALGGTSYGMWEETLGFFALLVPLVLALGYDRMVAVSIIFLGAGTGVLCSTVNPFATGVASDAAGIGLSDGLGLRVIMLVVLVPLAAAYVIRYAHKVHADPASSLVAGDLPPGEDAAFLKDADVEVPELTGRQKAVLVVFFGAFLMMIYGFIPWNDLWDTFFSKKFPLPTFGSFYFTEASMLFLVGAVVIGLIAKFGEKKTVDTIVAGAADFLGAALVIVAARGITVVMKNTYITDTVLHWMEDAVKGSTAAKFSAVAFLVNIPIAFLVPSSSGHAALVMPILAPLADFAGVQRSMTVTGFQSASGFVNLLTPTSAVVMGGLTLAKVRYDRYLRFLAPFLAVVFVLVMIAMVVGANFYAT